MFSVSHSYGGGETNPPIQCLSDLYDELQSADAEHGDVAVTNEDTAWSISAHRDGRVCLMNFAGKGPDMHMVPVSKEQVLALWRLLIDDEINEILVQPWKAGHT